MLSDEFLEKFVQKIADVAVVLRMGGESRGFVDEMGLLPEIRPNAVAMARIPHADRIDGDSEQRFHIVVMVVRFPIYR